MSYSAHANEYSRKNMAQIARNTQRMIDAEEAAREQVQVVSNDLADLIGYETPAWEEFWSRIPEPTTNVALLAALQAEVKRVDDERNWQDDRQLYADLKRGG